MEFVTAIGTGFLDTGTIFFKRKTTTKNIVVVVVIKKQYFTTVANVSQLYTQMRSALNFRSV